MEHVVVGGALHHLTLEFQLVAGLESLWNGFSREDCHIGFGRIPVLCGTHLQLKHVLVRRQSFICAHVVAFQPPIAQVRVLFELVARMMLVVEDGCFTGVTHKRLPAGSGPQLFSLQQWLHRVRRRRSGEKQYHHDHRCPYQELSFGQHHQAVSAPQQQILREFRIIRPHFYLPLA